MHSGFLYSPNVPKNKSLRAVLGENVAAIMKAKAMSQPKVAAAAKKHGTKVDQTTISRVARAVYPATVDTLEAISNGLDVHPWELLIPDRHDTGFLALLQAWSVTSPTGRDLIASAARVAIEKYGRNSRDRSAEG